MDAIDLGGGAPSQRWVGPSPGSQPSRGVQDRRTHPACRDVPDVPDRPDVPRPGTARGLSDRATAPGLAWCRGRPRRRHADRAPRLARHPPPRPHRGPLARRRGLHRRSGTSSGRLPSRRDRVDSRARRRGLAHPSRARLPVADSPGPNPLGGRATDRSGEPIRRGRLRQAAGRRGRARDRGRGRDPPPLARRDACPPGGAARRLPDGAPPTPRIGSPPPG